MRTTGCQLRELLAEHPTVDALEVVHLTCTRCQLYWRFVTSSSTRCSPLPPAHPRVGHGDTSEHGVGLACCAAVELPTSKVCLTSNEPWGAWPPGADPYSHIMKNDDNLLQRVCATSGRRHHLLGLLRSRPFPVPLTDLALLANLMFALISWRACCCAMKPRLSTCLTWRTSVARLHMLFKFSSS